MPNLADAKANPSGPAEISRKTTDFSRGAYGFRGYVFFPAQNAQYTPVPRDPLEPPDGKLATATDCGDAQYICLRTDSALGGSFTVPRACGQVDVGMVWGRGDAETVVLSKVAPDPDLARQWADTKPGQAPPVMNHAMVLDYYLLGNPRRPAIVFAYDPSFGIFAIYTQKHVSDPTPFAEAKAGHLPGLMDRAKSPAGPDTLAGPWDFATCSRR